MVITFDLQGPMDAFKRFFSDFSDINFFDEENFQTYSSITSITSSIILTNLEVN